MKRCSNCGAGNPDDAAFCSLCYTPFASGDEAAHGYHAPGGVHEAIEGRDTRREVGLRDADRDARWPLIAVVCLAAACLAAAVVLPVYYIWFHGRVPDAVPSTAAAVEVDLDSEPLQDPGCEGEVLLERGSLEVVALARYEISGVVLALFVNRAYGEEEEDYPFPVDLALLWGDVARTDYDSYLEYKHDKIWTGNQWLMTRIRPGAQLPEGMTDSYLMQHISNNHLMPASENIYNALANLEVKQEVILYGYLVSATTSTGHKMSSSLTRDDMDGGACECVYVEKVQVDDTVYE